MRMVDLFNETEFPEAESLRKFIVKILKTLGHEDKNISFAIVSGDTAKRLNKAFRGREGPAEVLSFAYGEKDVFGEIVLCPSSAAGKAEKENIDFRSYIRYLLIHAVLHLFGYEHGEEMDAKERELAESLGVELPWK